MKLDPLTARRFRTGRPCLDFAHTGGVGQWMDAELIHDGPSAERWLSHLVTVSVHATDQDVPAIRELRESIWQLAQARIAGDPLPPQHVATVNTYAKMPQPVHLLGEDGTVRNEVPDASAALSQLARDAVELFGGPQGERIRVCAATDCDLLFVDLSPAGRRRWCSMERCGNRAKVRAIRERAR